MLTNALTPTSTHAAPLKNIRAIAGSDSASVALKNKLERYNNQLSDWEGCPSGKTPEGKKIIAHLRAQIVTLQAQVRSDPGITGSGAASTASTASAASAASTASAANTTNTTSSAPLNSATTSAPLSCCGSLVNLYA